MQQNNLIDYRSISGSSNNGTNPTNLCDQQMSPILVNLIISKSFEFHFLNFLGLLCDLLWYEEEDFFLSFFLSGECF